METVFLDVQTALSTVAGLRHIGEDWGQLNFEQPPVNFPCALIDLGSVIYSSAGRNTQQAEAVLNITIADIRYNGITAVMPKELEKNAFSIFRLIEKINKALHGHGGECYSRLCRVSLKKVLREDAIREFVLSYKFGYTDSTAMPILTKAPVPPQIEVQG